MRSYEEMPPKNINEDHTLLGYLIDVSGSMYSRLSEVSGEINKVTSMLQQNSMANKMVESAVLTFSDDTKIIQGWRPISEVEDISLSSEGGTELQKAILETTDYIRERTHLLKRSGITVRRPQLFVVTDGYGGDVTEAARVIKERTRLGKLACWFLCVKGYDKKTIATLSDGERDFELKDENDTDYSEFFEKVVAASVISVSESQPGEKPKWNNPLKDPDSTLQKPDLDGWLLD